MIEQKNISVLILAAGISSRYKKNKIFEYINNTTFFEKIVNTYNTFNFFEIIVVINPSSYNYLNKINKTFNDSIKFVINENPELGRFYSLKLSSKIINKSNYCIFQNIDNPYIEKEVINKLIYNISSNDYIVPVYKNKSGHPAIISPNIIKQIELQNNNIKINEFLNKFKKSHVEVESDSILININSESDYELIKSKYYNE